MNNIQRYKYKYKKKSMLFEHLTGVRTCSRCSNKRTSSGCSTAIAEFRRRSAILEDPEDVPLLEHLEHVRTPRRCSNTRYKSD